MAYIGRVPTPGEVVLMNSIESQFNGSLTTFDLTRTVSGTTLDFYPVSSEHLLVSLGGVIQKPDPTGNVGFKIDYNQIIFAVAPAAGSSCFIISYGNILDIGTPGEGTVTPSKLSTGGPSWDTSSNLSISGNDIKIIPHSANSGHGIVYLRGDASNESSSIQLNHFGQADWFISAGRTGAGELSITNTDQGTDGIKLNTDGDLLPAADNALDLGSPSLRWANIYSADLQLSNEGSSNDVDGTWGAYTIQEGENDLYLLNRRNGKKYKFVLQEVN